MSSRTLSGFTLIEVAIVLLVAGMLMVGILKGQELMTAARVRSVIHTQESVRTAYFGFQDRFRAPPGDYSSATATLTGVSVNCGVPGNPGNGNGNSFVESANGESILLWDHLSKAGFLTVLYTCESNNTVNANTVPRNRYGQYLQLIYDSNYAGNPRNVHNLKTGNDMPSDVLAEVDRKIDDGNALRGGFRGTTYTTGGPTDATCWDPATGEWNAQASSANCAGATLF